MAITFSWSWNSLDTLLGPDDDGNENVVTMIHYGYKADNGEGVTAGTIGTVPLFRDPSDEWIEFDDIEESDIESWAVAAIGDQLVPLQAKLSGRIDEIVAPTRASVREMPWDDS